MNSCTLYKLNGSVNNQTWDILFASAEGASAENSQNNIGIRNQIPQPKQYLSFITNIFRCQTAGVEYFVFITKS